jgi:hypothetical protein
VGWRRSSEDQLGGGAEKQPIVVSMRKFDSDVWRSAKKKSSG